MKFEKKKVRLESCEPTEELVSETLFKVGRTNYVVVLAKVCNEWVAELCDKNVIASAQVAWRRRRRRVRRYSNRGCRIFHFSARGKTKTNAVKNLKTSIRTFFRCVKTLEASFNRVEAEM